MEGLILLLIGSFIGYFFAIKKFRFESAHKRRIEVIEQLYQNLIITHRAFKNVMRPLQLAGEDRDEKRKKLVSVANTFSNHFFEKRIFFEKDLSKDIENIISELQNLWNDWEFLVEFPDTPPKEKSENWMQIWKKIDTDMKTTIDNLETKFRNILGIQ